jgi:hypothetical protein
MPGKWSQFSEEQKDALLESLEGMYNDPEVGEVVQTAVEKKFGITDPGLAAARKHRAETDALRTQLQTLEAKQMEKEIRNRVDTEKMQAQKKYKLSDDDMKEVSKTMLENGIGSYDIAADYFTKSRQLAKPTTDHYQEHSSLTLPGDVELFKDRTAWARKEAYKAINEIERNR